MPRPDPTTVDGWTAKCGELEGENERLQRMLGNQQAQVAFMCEEVAKATKQDVASPADTVESVRTLMQMAELGYGWRDERDAARAELAQRGEVVGWVVVHEADIGRGPEYGIASSVRTADEAGREAIRNALGYCIAMQERERPGSEGRYFLAEVRALAGEDDRG